MPPVPSFTLLLVEDSRLCAERFRLMARSCNIRLRWAEGMTEADWHLRTYRPDALLVDIGLADGNGLDLIRLARETSPPEMQIGGLSGERDFATAALAAGADFFFSKDALTLAQFRKTFAPVPTGGAAPAALYVEAAFQSDLSRASSAIASGAPDYARTFLSGVVNEIEDPPLRSALEAITQAQSLGDTGARELAQLSSLLKDRLAKARPLDH